MSVERAQWQKELWRRFQQYDSIHDLLAELNILHSGTLADIWPDFIARGVFQPGWLYLGAPPAMTERLLALFDPQLGSSNDNGLLQALAWIGDARVVAQFQAWREQPPTWQRRLYMPAYDYAREAGWELTPKGERRQLYYADCYRLVHDEQPSNSALAGVGICGWCGRELAPLLDLDLTDPRLAFLRDGGLPDVSRVRIAHCLWCSDIVPTFTDIDGYGASVWSDENGPKPAILEKIGSGEDVWDTELVAAFGQPLIPGPARTNPFEALGSDLRRMGGDSQLGGHPDWIQKAKYPICPGCEQHMRNVGQIAWEDLVEGSEGITYAFLCLPCGKAATTYQQT